MSNLDKYRGIIPAFYACYDEEGRTLHRQSMLRPYGRYRQKAAEHRISS